MNRRLFLKRSIGIATGLAAMPFVSPVLTASPRAQRGFSIRLVTDQPSRAIDRMSAFFQRTGVGASHIRFEEHVLAGQHVGDLVMTHGARLYNFWKIDAPMAGALRTIAQELDLPRHLSQPVMLSFSTEQVATEAAYVQIFQGNLLLQQLRLDQNRVHHVVEGTKGRLTLTVKDKQVAIVEASCKHKTCMKMGAIAKSGEALVCVPNQLSIALDGRKQQPVDGITF